MLMRLKYHVKIHPWRSTSFPYQNTPKWLHRHYLMPTPRHHFQRPLSHLARVTKTIFFFFSYLPTIRIRRITGRQAHVYVYYNNMYTTPPHDRSTPIYIIHNIHGYTVIYLREEEISALKDRLNRKRLYYYYRNNNTIIYTRHRRQPIRRSFFYVFIMYVYRTHVLCASSNIPPSRHKTFPPSDKNNIVSCNNVYVCNM